MRKLRVSMIVISLLGLTGCASYPNQFKCGDAKGLGCTMLREVDIQIDSGQVEQVYQGKCRSSAPAEGLRVAPQRVKFYNFGLKSATQDSHSLAF